MQSSNVIASTGSRYKMKSIFIMKLLCQRETIFLPLMMIRESYRKFWQRNRLFLQYSHSNLHEENSFHLISGLYADFPYRFSFLVIDFLLENNAFCDSPFLLPRRRRKSTTDLTFVSERSTHFWKKKSFPFVLSLSFYQ